MKSSSLWCRLAARLMFVLVLGGGVGACAALLKPDTPPTRYYVLSALADPSTESLADPAPTIGVATVTLAQHLDHRSLVVRTGPNELSLAEFDQWAAPLDQQVAIALAENLTSQVRTGRVIPLPTSRAVQLDYQIETSVIAFEWTWEGAVVLTVHWAVLDGNATRELAFGRSTYRKPVSVKFVTGEDGSKAISPATYQVIVAAMSETLADLGDEIAASVRLVHARSSRAASVSDDALRRS